MSIAGWHFGWFMCKATPYMQGVAVCASVNTLAAIAVDRYLAICHSIKLKIGTKCCKLIIACIWVAAFTIMIPWAMYYKLDYWKPDTVALPMCFESWPDDKPAGERIYFLCAIFLCCYSVPLFLIVACYFLIGLRVVRRRAPGVKNSSSEVVYRSKVKAVKMLAIVVVMFALSWLPLYVIRLKTLFYGTSSNKQVEYIVRDIINPIAQWLGSSNSGMNPIIYCFFSKRYRRGFKDAITCCRVTNSRRSLANALATHSFVNGSSGKKPRLMYAYERNSPDKSLSDSNTYV